MSQIVTMESVTKRRSEASRDGDLSYEEGECLLVLDCSQSAWWLAERVEGWAGLQEAGKGM